MWSIEDLKPEGVDCRLEERKVRVCSLDVEKACLLCWALNGRFKCEWGKVFIVFNPKEVR